LIDGKVADRQQSCRSATAIDRLATHRPAEKLPTGKKAADRRKTRRVKKAADRRKRKLATGDKLLTGKKDAVRTSVLITVLPKPSDDERRKVRHEESVARRNAAAQHAVYAYKRRTQTLTWAKFRWSGVNRMLK
jgi:hypothetical protein